MPTVSEIKGARANAGIRWLVPAKVAVFIAMLFPLARLVVLGMTGGLGANPIEFITRSTGLWTLVYLCITLAITPVRRMTGITALARFRRMIGLYAFFFAVLHFTTYIWFDKWFDVAAMLKDIGKRPFITACGHVAQSHREKARPPLADLASGDLSDRRARDPAFLVDEGGQARFRTAEDLRFDRDRVAGLARDRVASDASDTAARIKKAMPRHRFLLKPAKLQSGRTDSPANNCFTSSRSRTRRARSPSTMISAARGRVV
jgi:hypothetical protein